MEALIKTQKIKESKVGIAEWQVLSAPARLITLGLGSCVGIAIYDRTFRIGGLAHIMLADSTQFNDKNNRAKFADLAIPDMFNEMVRKGAKRHKMVAKIAGGAQMFSSTDRHLSVLNIGQRNVEMVKNTLKNLNIPIINEDTGGNYGRTLIFDLETGEVHIRVMGRGIKTI
ncbi:MAG: chemotaxis protein CheD [Clostridia bacterium]|nr:chemotaxis protein CheD [Clostridia bacterium]